MKELTLQVDFDEAVLTLKSAPSSVVQINEDLTTMFNQIKAEGTPGSTDVGHTASIDNDGFTVIGTYTFEYSLDDNDILDIEDVVEDVAESLGYNVTC